MVFGGWRTTRQSIDDLDESIRPRDLMHVQLYVPLYQRIASEMSGAGPQMSKDATSLLAGEAGNEGAKVMMRATAMSEMVLSRAPHLATNVDNDKPNTLSAVVQEGTKAVCSGGLIGGTRRSKSVSSVTTIITSEVSQLTDLSHEEEVNDSPECTHQDHDDDRPK
jgi:hypothetical protein